MCLGTGALGIGADVRQASLSTRAGTWGGRRTPTPSTATVMEGTNEGLDWLEFCPSAAAQQLSAWACVRPRPDPELCESALCIGHSDPSAQHAIRASGVGSQPAQTAAFPATRPNASATAVRRWTSLDTPLGCLTVETLSNEWSSELGGRLVTTAPPPYRSTAENPACCWAFFPRAPTGSRRHARYGRIEEAFIRQGSCVLVVEAYEALMTRRLRSIRRSHARKAVHERPRGADRPRR